MNRLLLRSSRLTLVAHAALALVFGALGVLGACRTEDPRPGRASGGSASSAGGSGTPPASGGVDFGVGEGGVGGEGGDRGAATGGRDSGSGGGSGIGSATGSGGGNPQSGGGCGEAPVFTGEFSKNLLLKSAGACSAFQACLFSEVAFQLGREVTRYADDPSQEQLERARAAWIDAVEVWSATTPAQYGPIAGVAVDSHHGRGIGAFVHSWPALNRCEVEKQVVGRGYEELGFVGVVPSARGLSALEYLLFYEGTDTVCSANSSTGKTWLTLSVDELADAKRDYARALVQDVYLKAEELVNVWAEDGENFGAQLTSYEGYGSEQEALNVVAWSLLYPYESVRDLKVGPLAGIGTALPNPMSPYAQVDLESILENLAAFRALFEGCGEDGAGIGFDDWLVAAGAGDLGEDVLTAMDAIEARAATLPPLHEASTDELTAFYADLKVLSDLLKERLFGSGSILNLKLPDSAASDTD